jgi:two-component system, sensor histidine kinase RpfC
MNPEDPEKRPFASASARIAAAPQPDFDQTLLRLFIAAGVLAYMVWYVMRDGVLSENEKPFLFSVLAFFAFAVAMAAAVVMLPRGVKVWRVAAIVADSTAATYTLVVCGESGALLVTAYLAITLGNGLHYGVRYLRIAQMTCMIGFSLVLMISPFWSRHFGFGLGFLLALIIVGALAERLKASRQKPVDTITRTEEETA